MYLLAHDAMRFRTSRTYNGRRLLTVVALLAVLPIAHASPALAALAAVTAVCWALVAWEALRYSNTRARIRHA
jgi:hypothetical protein